MPGYFTATAANRYVFSSTPNLSSLAPTYHLNGKMKHVILHLAMGVQRAASLLLQNGKQSGANAAHLVSADDSAIGRAGLMRSRSPSVSSPPIAVDVPIGIARTRSTASLIDARDAGFAATGKQTTGVDYRPFTPKELMQQTFIPEFTGEELLEDNPYLTRRVSPGINQAPVVGDMTRTPITHTAVDGMPIDVENDDIDSGYIGDSEEDDFAPTDAPSLEWNDFSNSGARSSWNQLSAPDPATFFTRGLTLVSLGLMPEPRSHGIFGSIIRQVHSYLPFSTHHRARRHITDALKTLAAQQSLSVKQWDELERCRLELEKMPDGRTSYARTVQLCLAKLRNQECAALVRFVNENSDEDADPVVQPHIAALKKALAQEAVTREVADTLRSFVKAQSKKPDSLLIQAVALQNLQALLADYAVPASIAPEICRAAIDRLTQAGRIRKASKSLEGPTGQQRIKEGLRQMQEGMPEEYARNYALDEGKRLTPVLNMLATVLKETQKNA